MKTKFISIHKGGGRRSNYNFTKKSIDKRSKSDSINRLFDDFLDDFNHRFEIFFEDLNYRFDKHFDRCSSEIDDYFEKYFYRFENHLEKLYYKEEFSMGIDLSHEIDLNLFKNTKKRLVFDKILSIKEKDSLKMTFEEFFPNLNIDDRKIFFLLNIIIKSFKKRNEIINKKKYYDFFLLIQLYCVITRIVSIGEIKTDTQL